MQKVNGEIGVILEKVGTWEFCGTRLVRMKQLLNYLN